MFAYGEFFFGLIYILLFIFKIMKNNDDIFPLNDCDIVLLVATKYNFEIPQIISIYLRLNT